MRHRPEHILRITAPLRGLADRFAYVFLLAAAFAILVLGKADPQIFERARMTVTDMTAPVLDALSRPAMTVASTIEEVKELGRLRDENQALRSQNILLLKWQTTARTLMAENDQLRGLLGFGADPEASSVTARVIGDSGGAFVRSVLVNAGRRVGVRKGQAAAVGSGLLGRVAEVGERSARILLITDLNSRIPVVIESSRERAVLAGDNSASPRLHYLPITTKVKLGDRIVTSGHGGVFPPGLPVGIVTSVAKEGVRVRPYAAAERLEYIRLMDYGLNGMLDEMLTRDGAGNTGRLLGKAVGSE
ncbi:MAG: rod shape-determining protein MreC [Alphaproteobacteria bacterium]|nr:rod shape-determining protein MreC [Alphaproteobacteria bacterium]